MIQMRAMYCKMYFAASLLLTGCYSAAQLSEATRVRMLDPKPIVDLPRSAQTMTLEFDAEVPDAFQAHILDNGDGTLPVPVESWHASLTNGFKSGPGKFFATARDGESDLKLVMVSAKLDYVPTALVTQGAKVLGPGAVRARIRYIARLVRGKDEVIARAQGEVSSTQDWTSMGGSATTCSEAIEAMWMDLSKQLFGGETTR